jgi:hypothetical protein
MSNKLVPIKQDKTESPVRQIFRGFIGGISFVTKKGYKGSRMDTKWCKFIFDSFENDDDELALIALESTIADLQVKVSGGEYGTPFEIGDLGFYSKSQYEKQAMILEESERTNAIGIQFLSDGEWDRVNAKLSEIAHHGVYKFSRAYKGDSFANLAIRANAYLVASVMMNRGIDPMVENEHGDDLFDIIIQQYSDLSDDLKHVQAEIEQSTKRIFLPSETKELFKKERNVITNFENIIVFIDLFIVNLKFRFKTIEEDVWLQRKAKLRQEVSFILFIYYINNYYLIIKLIILINY